MAAIKAAQAAFRALLQLQCIQRFITTGRGVSWHWNTPPQITLCAEALGSVRTAAT